MAYRIAASPMTLSDLQGYSPISNIFKWNFRTVKQQLARFQLISTGSASRGPSAIAVLRVKRWCDIRLDHFHSWRIWGCHTPNFVQVPSKLAVLKNQRNGQTDNMHVYIKPKMFVCLSVCRPRHQGGAHGGRAPAKNRQGPGKITDHVPSGLPHKFFWYFEAFLVFKKRKRPNGYPVFHGGWVTLTLIPPVTRLTCIVWVLSLFLGSIDARTWRGYKLYGPRPQDGPHWQFQSGDGAAVCISRRVVKSFRTPDRPRDTRQSSVQTLQLSTSLTTGRRQWHFSCMANRHRRTVAL